MLAAAQLPTTVLSVDRAFYKMRNPDFRMDQGAEGTCVGHAITNVCLAGPTPHRNFPAFETVNKAHLWARQLYFDATGDATYQEGAYPRDACQVLLDRGMVDSYWRVSSLDDIQTCLLTFGPLSVSWPWYNSMFNTNVDAHGNHWLRYDIGSGLAGYHEIALTAIDLAPDDGSPPFVRLENSWGPMWAQNGTARVTIDQLKLLNMTDNWTFAEKVF